MLRWEVAESSGTDKAITRWNVGMTSLGSDRHVPRIWSLQGSCKGSIRYLQLNWVLKHPKAKRRQRGWAAKICQTGDSNLEAFLRGSQGPAVERTARYGEQLLRRSAQCLGKLASVSRRGECMMNQQVILALVVCEATDLLNHISKPCGWEAY